MTEQQLRGRNVITSEGLERYLTIPSGAQAMFSIFLWKRQQYRSSSRNQLAAKCVLNNKGIAALIVDLLNHKEERIGEKTKHLGCNIEQFCRRFAAATNWLAQQPETTSLKAGHFGSSTGAAAALTAAARLAQDKAIVTRGTHSDLADESTCQPS